MSKKTFITGASGFVGKVTINQLIARNVEIIASVRTINATLPLEVQTLKIDDIANLSEAFRGISNVDTVIHIAAKAHEGSVHLSEFRIINTVATLNLAKIAVSMGVKRFVFVSSIGVNGISTDSEPFSVNSTPNPHNAYAQSKYDAELGLQKIAKETGLEVVIVRPTLVYGPNAPGNFGMLTKLVHKMPFLPFGLANNRRDFISVQNLADLLVTCATHPNAGGHTFLASENETVSIKEFTDAIAKGLGKKVIQLPIPVSLMRLAGKLTGKSALIEQLFGNLEVNSSNIQQVLGWTPPLTMEQSMTSLKNWKINNDNSVN